MEELKTICGPVLTKLTLNCEQILDLMSENQSRTDANSVLSQDLKTKEIEQKLK